MEQEQLTVKKAALIAYNSMPEHFNMLDLIRKTRVLVNRPDLYDGTVLRSIRFLKSDGEIRYKVVHKKQSKYQKIMIGKQLNIDLDG